MNRAAYYSSRPANSGSVILAGLKQLRTESERLRARSAWIVTPIKDNINGFISETIGDVAAKALVKGKTVPFFPGCELKFYTNATFPFSSDGSPVLVCYPDMKLLNKIDRLGGGAPAVIVLPWAIEWVQQWIDANAPTDILGQRVTKSRSLENAVVARALNTLIGSINLGTGITHPNDKHKTIELFRILRDAKEPYDPADVRAWLVQNGVDPEHADDIAAIARDPSKFRAVSGLPRPWQPDILALWRSGK